MQQREARTITRLLEKGQLYVQNRGGDHVVKLLSHEFTLGEAKAFALAYGMRRTDRIFWQAGAASELVEVTNLGEMKWETIPS